MLVVVGLVVNGLGPVFPEICLKGNWLQSWLSPKKEKDWTGLDFQTLLVNLALLEAQGSED